MISSLQALVAPLDLTCLTAALYERRVVHLRTGNQTAFQRLLPWSAFNSLLSAERLVSGRLRVLRRGRDLPQEMWTLISRDLARVPLPDQLQRLCRNGVSIAIPEVSDALPAIAALNAMLERALAARLQTNLYASFGREGAYRAHHDDHDVLILHIHGRKRWALYGRRPAAYADTSVVPDDVLGKPQSDLVLEPGDILYVPRGEVHRASVEGEASLHLTTALVWPRGADMIKWLVNESAESREFGRDIPAYGSADDLARYERDIRAALHRLAETLDIRAFLAAFEQGRMPKLPLNLGLAAAPGPEIWVQTVLRHNVALPEEGGAEIRINGMVTSLDAQERAVLAVLLARGALQLADLPDLCGLSMEAASAVVSRLADRSLVLLSEG